MRAVGAGTGKLLLFGEHAAVYGFPAVGMALPLETKVTVDEEEGHAGRDYCADLLGLYSHAVDLARETGRAQPSPRTVRTTARIVVESEVPIGVGLGSSAALCVALARAAASAEANGLPPGGPQIDHRIWRMAHELESAFHGTPSGIDTGLAALGGVRAFRRISGVTKDLPDAAILRHPSLAMVIVTIERRSTTRALVAEVRRRYRQDPGGVRVLLDELGEIAEQAAIRLTVPTSEAAPGQRSAEDASVLGRMADEAHGRLARIGVSSDESEYVLHRLRSAGACGAKLSGAGGGGALFGIFEDPNDARTARGSLVSDLQSRSVDYRVWVMESDPNGAILERRAREVISW